MKKLVCGIFGTIYYAQILKNGLMSDSNRKDVTDDALVSVLHHLKAQTGYMHDGWFGYSYGPEDAKVNLVAYDTNKYKLVKKDLVGVEE